MPSTLTGKTLQEPQKAHAGRRRFARPDVPQLANANSLSVPTHRYPARGWVLLRKEDLDSLDAYAPQTLVFDDFSTSLTFTGLYIVTTRCVTTGVIGSTSDLHLVELTDARGIYRNPQFRKTLNAQFNVRSPAYPDQYYTGSINGTAPWTWSQMVQTIWETMPLLGTYPTLPTFPGQLPEGWIFAGVSAFDALCDVLDLIGCVVTWNPVGNVYSVAQVGAADSSFATLSTQYTLAEDLQDSALGSGSVPASVTVNFHRRNQFYGTEEQVRRDSSQWSTTPEYQKSIATTYMDAEGNAILWADFTVQYDVSGSTVAASASAADAYAAELAAYLVARITRGQGRMHRWYLNLAPFTVGSLVDGVCWRFGPAELTDQEAESLARSNDAWKMPSRDMRRWSWSTEIIRTPDGQCCVDECGQFVTMPWNETNVQPPMFGPGYPLYPEVAQAVRVYGSTVAGVLSNVYAGFVQQSNHTTASQGGLRDREACFVYSPNGTTGPAIAPSRLIDSYIAGDGTSLPLYLVGSPATSSGTGLTSLNGLTGNVTITGQTSSLATIGVTTSGQQIPISLTAINLNVLLPAGPGILAFQFGIGWQTVASSSAGAFIYQYNGNGNYTFSGGDVPPGSGTGRNLLQGCLSYYDTSVTPPVWRYTGTFNGSGASPLTSTTSGSPVLGSILASSGTTFGQAWATPTQWFDQTFGTLPGSMVSRGSTWGQLGPGTATQFLGMGGSPLVPTWSALPASTVYARKTGNQNGITAAVDVSDLGVAVASGQTIRFECYLRIDTSATIIGASVAVNGPTSTILAYTTREWTASATQITTGHVAYDDFAAISTSAGATERVYEIVGVAKFSASGTFTPRAQANGVAATMDVLAGSWIEYDLS